MVEVLKQTGTWHVSREVFKMSVDTLQKEYAVQCSAPLGERGKAWRESWETPNKLKDLQVLLKLYNYYHKFVLSLAELASLFHSLLKRGLHSCGQMRTRMLLPQLKESFSKCIINTDASNHSTGMSSDICQQPSHTNSAEVLCHQMGYLLFSTTLASSATT